MWFHWFCRLMVYLIKILNVYYNFYNVGLAVVTKEQAFLWTDGRYHLQASQELDLNLWTLMRQGKPYSLQCHAITV